MVLIKHYFAAIILLISCYSPSFSQTKQQFGFAGQLQKDPDTRIAFSVTNTPGALERLLKDPSVNVKSVTPEWIFIQASAAWIQKAKENGVIESFYFEHSLPVALNDTSLVTHHVTEVHNGSGGLQTPFTGKDVIIGYVDQGWIIPTAILSMKTGTHVYFFIGITRCLTRQIRHNLMDMVRCGMPLIFSRLHAAAPKKRARTEQVWPVQVRLTDSLTANKKV